MQKPPDERNWKTAQIIDEKFPHHEVLLVLDPTGQNAISQAKSSKSNRGFRYNINQIDGTAKGGIVLLLRLEIPVKLAGIRA